MRPAARVAVVLLLAGACATSPESLPREALMRDVLTATVQLRAERDGGGRGTASGVVVATDRGSARSWVVTTRHFVDRARPESLVIIVAGRAVPGTIASTSRDRDLAMVEVAGLGLAPARLRREPTPLGQHVWVVGFPWGRGRTVASGIVSQLAERGDDTVGRARMVDASVSYGASGGGVFDVATGDLIAVVEGYRTANVTWPADRERVLQLPVPGETLVIPADAILELAQQAGIAGFLRP